MTICKNSKCKKETDNPKYCSRSCSATITGSTHPKRKSSTKLEVCLHCGIKLGYANYTYCSNTCQKEYAFQKRLLLALISGYFTGTQSTIKRQVIYLNGHSCSVCGISSWCGKPAPLVLDHIDGNSSNSNIENLRLVCGNCDMQLPTYKSKNKGNGRHSRRERYAEGKSY